VVVRYVIGFVVETVSSAVDIVVLAPAVVVVSYVVMMVVVVVTQLPLYSA
jgi:hypothetical protein